MPPGAGLSAHVSEQPAQKEESPEGGSPDLDQIARKHITSPERGT